MAAEKKGQPFTTCSCQLAFNWRNRQKRDGTLPAGIVVSRIVSSVAGMAEVLDNNRGRCPMCHHGKDGSKTGCKHPDVLKALAFMPKKQEPEKEGARIPDTHPEAMKHRGRTANVQT